MPPAVAREALRLAKEGHTTSPAGVEAAVMPSLFGIVFAFGAGLLALRWLSRWLESGRWYLFGIYCLLVAVVVAGLYRAGY